MKITELKCTACGGELKINPETPNLAVCEYCKRQYGIEWESEGAAHFKMPDQSWHTPREPLPVEEKEKTGWEAYGWKRGVALAVLGVVVLFGMNYKGIQARYTENQKAKKASSTYVPSKPADDAVTAEPLFKGGMEEFVESVFGKPQEQISPEELAQINTLEIRYSDGMLMGYGMQDSKELTWLPISTDISSYKSINYFSGLKSLSINGKVSPEMLEGLHIAKLKCYSDSIDTLTASLEFPDELTELEVSGGLSSLDAIGELTGLTSLTLYTDDITDLSPLAQAKNLQKLDLQRCNQVSDYSVLPTLTTLTELSIDSDTLKGLGFLKQMPQLTSFSVEDATLINLDGIQDLNNLKSLSIISCDDTENMRELSQLSGLEHLELEIPYNCEEPDLSGLTALKTLSIDNMDHLNFLASMPELQSLKLNACSVDNVEIFSKLVALKELKCSYMSGQLDYWSFVRKLPALETLDLTGVATYEDISSLFTIPTLKKLMLSGAECEINFQKLSPNPSLQALEISGIKLYKNVNVQGGGGIYQIDYDNVSLTDHMDFLANFPNLSELNLSGNKLTDLSALQSLSQLSVLNIEDNFVTDLKPLTGLSALKTLWVKGNPVENYQILSDKITIIK